MSIKGIYRIFPEQQYRRIHILLRIPRKQFSQNMVDHCNGNKKVRSPANKTWDKFNKYEFEPS